MVDIQRAIRGYLARKLAAEERELIELAWMWVSVGDRSAFMQHMPKHSYAVPRLQNDADSELEDQLKPLVSAMPFDFISPEFDCCRIACLLCSIGFTLAITQPRRSRGVMSEQSTTERESIRMQKRGYEGFDWTQMNLFTQYDKDKAGVVSKAQFTAAIKTFFANNDSLISTRVHLVSAE